MNIPPIQIGLIAVLVLLAIGFYGLLIFRNFIRIIIALQIISKGVVLLLVLAGLASNRLSLAQSISATFIVADTVVAVIGLALAVQIHRCRGTLDLKALGTAHKDIED